MLQAYSLNVAVNPNSAVPFNNIVIEKGQTAILKAPSSIELNKSGVYMIECNASAAASATIQLSRDGLLIPYATSTGTSMNFSSLVQVKNNNCCNNCYSSPTIISILNPTDAVETFTDINIVVTKIC